jgi:hypothetical protein
MVGAAYVVELGKMDGRLKKYFHVKVTRFVNRGSATDPTCTVLIQSTLLALS